MDTTPGSSFSHLWHKERERRWQKWYDAIQRDPNYARLLFNLPLIEPVRTGVRRTADMLGYRWPQTTAGEHETESPRDHPQD